MSRSHDRTTARTDDVDAAADAIRVNARPLSTDGFGPLVDSLADADCVLLGEASHGTAEFYRWRARLTARLLRDHGFSFVAVEGDWTDCHEVNRYVRATDDERRNVERRERTAREVLDGFDRWPTWMWANWETVEFVEWLADHNADRPRDEQAGFYGLDVYSLFESMDAVVDYLEEHEPEAVERARDAYRCFEPYGEDAREYGRSTRLVPESCEDEVVEILSELRRRTAAPEESPDAQFDAEQNALVARNAERYYRSMVRGSAESWNVRDRHMVETLERLCDHHGPDAKAVVWAHNTHVGDARATDMERQGKVNVGQLARESDAVGDAAIVGFGTHRGGVVAAEAWDAPMEEMRVPPARRGSWGDAFHRADVGDAYLLFEEMDVETDPETGSEAGGGPLDRSRGHRAIGVVYDPDREQYNYVPTLLPRRYDAFVHVDETSALHPLHAEPEGAREPETFPWGL